MRVLVGILSVALMAGCQSHEMPDDQSSPKTQTSPGSSAADNATSPILTNDYFPDWGCYDPMPGHPTPTERAEFVEEVSKYAIQAETDHGVPAAAIAAQAVIESGFGWTRTAVNANNLFGWKYVSNSAAGGRDFWALDCQPSWDINNKYVRFKDRRDAVDFVASRLANSGYYSADTKKYQADKDAGVNTTTAVDAWVDGISEPYNYKPEEYAATVKAIMREFGLYSLSMTKSADTFSPAAAQTQLRAALLNQVRTYFDAKIFPGGASSDARYTAENCEPHNAPVAGYDRYPVERCEYGYGVGGDRRTAILYSLNPSPEQLASWVDLACSAANRPGDLHCANVVSARIWCSNNAQFPVSGIVLEKASEANWTSLTGLGIDPVLYIEFRDGVAVRTNTPVEYGRPDELRIGSYRGDLYAATSQQSVDTLEIAAAAPAITVFRWARVAAANRQQYRRHIEDIDLGRPGGTGTTNLRWLQISRESYLNAWDGGEYTLLNAWAIDAEERAHFDNFQKGFTGCPIEIYR